MTALRPSALLRHRLGVWLLAALTLWGACAPLLVRAQVVGAGMAGMEVCTAMGAMHADVAAPGDGSSPSVHGAAQCPWCLLALDLSQALPAPGVAALLATPAQPPQATHQHAPVVRSAWVVSPPSRGPPLQQSL
jgi:hypothetical protein